MRIVSTVKKLFKRGSGDTLRIISQAYVIKRLLPQKLENLCEVGCGSAGPLYSKYLIKHSTSYTGIDGYEPNIILAKERYHLNEKTQFVLEDVCQLNKQESDCFDYVVSTEVIEHVNDEKSMLKEICRILKKGGTAVVSTPLIHVGNVDEPVPPSDAHKAINFNVYEDHKVDGFLEHDLVKTIESTGFTVFKKRYCYYFPAKMGENLLRISGGRVPVFFLLLLSLLDLVFAVLRLGKPYDIILFLKKA
jgi:2-polyprenyl-3-methyl-5-hydroxy-6-metoxy-1,4-benzoquinol methylase